MGEAFSDYKFVYCLQMTPSQHLMEGQCVGMFFARARAIWQWTAGGDRKNLWSWL